MLALTLTIAFTRCWRTLILVRNPTQRPTGARRTLLWVGALAQVPWFILGFIVRVPGIILMIAQGKCYFDGFFVGVVDRPSRRCRARAYLEPLPLLNFAGLVVIGLVLAQSLLQIRSHWGTVPTLALIAWASSPAFIDFHLVTRRRVRRLTPMASSLARVPWRTSNSTVHGQLQRWVPSPAYLIAYEPLVTSVYLVAWPNAIAMQLDNGIPLIPHRLRPPLCIVIV